MRALTAVAATLGSLTFAAIPACNCGFDPLEVPRPHMIVQPKAVDLPAAPVAQDTRITIQVSYPSIVNLEDIAYELTGPNGEGEPDPQLRIEDKPPLTEVFAGQTGEIVLIVRPLVVTEIRGTLVITAQKEAKPNRVEVPIVVHSIDAGLPDICDYPHGRGNTDTSIQFNGVGQNSVGRDTVQFDNCGIRNLIIDGVFLCDDAALETIDAAGELPSKEACEGADDAFHIADIAPGYAIEQGEQGATGLQLLFEPTDLVEHRTNVVIASNDPDENPVIIPVSGTGRACPTACIQLVDSPITSDGQIEPFDSVQFDGTCSTPADGSSALIASYDWSLLNQPTGSTAELELSATAEVNDFSQLTADLAGNYTVQLNVTDTDGVSSCAPATLDVHVVPSEDLHIQLVWDTPESDLDLHVVGDGGEPFTHETDCYFSNKHPTPDDCAANASLCSWVTDVVQNPSLDHDDNDGYGPENTNIVHPAPNSHWKIFVHYWNKKALENPRTTATLRIFVYGQQQMELQFTFEDDQQMWEAVDVTWPETFGDPASLAQIGHVVPFARPF